MTSVVVAVDGEATRRAALSLSTHPGIDRVSVLGPTDFQHLPVVDTTAGHDILLASRPAPDHRSDLPMVVAANHLDRPGIYGASPEGLALALAGGSGETDLVALARPGSEGGDVDVVFPSPIDGRSGIARGVAGLRVVVAEGEGSLGAAMALGSMRHRVVVDDYAFMEGISLAAGVALLIDGENTTTRAVWQDPERYLAAAAAMGLVVGERAATTR